MWTSKGFCFPKDLTYGTEIFTIDPQNKLVTTPIIDDISEHSSIRVNTIFTKNNIATFIPNYRILSDGKFVSGSEITNKDSLHYTDSKIVEGFKEFQEKNVIEYSERAPFSAIVASYLAACGVKDSKGAVYFELVDEDSSKKFAKQLQENLLPELGGDVSITKGVVSQSKFGEKGISHLVLYRSEKFYNLRTSIDFTEDKILNSIYQNGLFIYFRFLNSLLSKGHPYHLNWFVRGLSEKYVILYLPWKSKIRKLLQNSCHL